MVETLKDKNKQPTNYFSTCYGYIVGQIGVYNLGKEIRLEGKLHTNLLISA